MKRVFLSYRRADDAQAGRIADGLDRIFGRGTVFRDVVDLRAGADFHQSLRAAIQDSSVVLVVIGSGSKERLENPDDYVRQEVETALTTGRPILPVLLDGTQMPTVSELPESIRKLSSLQAAPVRGGADFNADLDRLATAIEHLSGELRRHGSRLEANSDALERLSAVGPVAVAVLSLALGCVLLYVMVAHAQTLSTWGLVGNFWFALLIALGLAASIAVFSSAKAYARYHHTTGNGNLQLGGPVVVFFLVIVLGHKLVPPPLTSFDFTVFVHGPGGVQDSVLRNAGRVTLHLGPDPRSEPIGEKGEARFVGIPANMRDREVPIGVVAEAYELASERTAKLVGSVVYVSVRPREIKLYGSVRTLDGRPVVGASVNAGEQTVRSDSNGRFEFKFLGNDRFPVDVVVVADEFEPYRTSGNPGGNGLQVLLEPKSKP